MQFSEFSTYLQELEGLSSRLDMTAKLSALYKTLSPQEMVEASYLLLGRLVPLYQSLEFQMSEKMIVRALARLQPEVEFDAADLFGEQADGALEQVQARFKTLGDIGLVAEAVMSEYWGENEAKKTVTVSAVFDQLVAIARAAGAGSQEQKLELLVALLKQLDPVSAKFVTRIIVGKVRLGFSTMTMLDALSWAATGDKSETKALDLAYQKKADIGLLAQTYLAEKDQAQRLIALDAYAVEVGVPVVPQLCQRLNSAEEMIEKMTTVYAEPKYDGLRVQIHLNKKAAPGNQYAVFTRSLEDATHMFPEIAELAGQLNADQVILDGEAIGYDRATGALLPFQDTITRKRKHDVAEVSADIPLKFFIFDVLFVDGSGYLDTPLQERKDVLDKLLIENEHFVKTKFLTTSDPKELEEFHEEQLAEGLEGMVVKQLDAPYQSGRKGWSWVKMKEKAGTQGKLTDTIDGIVLGYYLGRGKRTQFGLGALLVGILDTTNSGEQIVTLAKTGTGMSEAQLVELKELCDAAQVADKPEQYVVHKSLLPDVWVRPKVVVELAADEITTSKNHSAGKALRFPRLLKIRRDKTWEQATTTTELSSIVIEGASMTV